MGCNLYFHLPGGVKMPAIGYGTWLSNDEEQLEQAVNVALETGYRHIDTAYLYQNEHVTGKVLQKWFSSGKLSRKDIFLVTKLPPKAMRPESVPIYLKQSLTALQVDYVDMYLIHTPFGMKEVEGVMFPTKEDGLIDLDLSTDLIGIWKAMEDQVDLGLTKTIGISNFNIKQARRILENARIPPCCLQIELHAYFQQTELADFCSENNMVVTAYSPLGSPGLKQLGLDLPDILANPIVEKIARKHKKTPAQVLLRHIIQKKIVVIPKSVNPSRIVENYTIFDFELDENDMKALNDLNTNTRIVDFNKLSKGVKLHPEYPFDDCK